MTVALDTNFIVYAEGVDDGRKRDIAWRFIMALNDEGMLLPLQVAAETARVLSRKYGRTAEAAAAAVGKWSGIATLTSLSSDCFREALDLHVRHQTQIFDAMILTTAAEAGCRLLLSEDFQDGFVWRGCTVANPFAARLHPLLASALDD
jgi:predicted nucleic acid-binding protein